MKRYIELICAILKWAEQKNSVAAELPPEIPGYTPAQVHYHIGLCGEAGYLHIEKTSGADAPFPAYAVQCLTWRGHETLAQRRGQS